MLWDAVGILASVFLAEVEMLCRCPGCEKEEGVGCSDSSLQERQLLAGAVCYNTLHLGLVDTQ